MKKTTLLLGLSSAIVSINLIGCKVDQKIKPTAVSTEHVTTNQLTMFLSRSLNVSPTEINLNSSQQFVIKNNVRIDEKRVEASYNNANEYKIKYGTK